MGRLKVYLLLLQIFILVISCGSAPQATEAATTELASEVVSEIVSESEEIEIFQEEEDFNPVNITQEYYETTRDDVRLFIEELNRIIRNQDYNAWKMVLSSEYFEEISSTQNLLELSELPAMKARRITLRTPEDYFMHVVIPSRANSRVDDIEFISMYRVKAFTINMNRAGEEHRLLLYNLEKTGDMWKIIN